MEALKNLMRADFTEEEVTRIIRDAVADGIVLDTWMNSEQEEYISAPAMDWLADALATRIAPAVADGPPLLGRLEDVLEAVREIVLGTALFHAQRAKGKRAVDHRDAEAALARVEDFVAHQAGGWVSLRVLYLVITAHEDLNALAYYGSMRQDDFLLGTLHRPWSEGVFHGQLAHYRRLGLVDVQYRGQGETVMLTPAGHTLLTQLRRTLEASGEFAWRAEAQRWTIFGELDYDAVLPHVFPDATRLTRDFLGQLAIRSGMHVLEVGCGTGRVTLDLGLHRQVGGTGRLVGLDPSRSLLNQLEAKRQAAGIGHVETVQGVAEHLPFADQTFDACVAVASLHFTNVEQAVQEMVRVTKPGGLVAALCPPPQTDFREIPMVALWFRPLAELAETWGLPFGERTGLAPGALEQTFRRHLSSVAYSRPTSTMSASDPEAFLAFVLKGGAFYQNLLCRVPYADRWDLIRQLERRGRDLIRHTTSEEQVATLRNEAVVGFV